MFNVFIMLNVEQSAATSVVQILSLLLVRRWMTLPYMNVQFAIQSFYAGRVCSGKHNVTV